MMDNRRYRIAKEGEKYYSDPNNLACPGCLKVREEEGYPPPPKPDPSITPTTMKGNYPNEWLPKREPIFVEVMAVPARWSISLSIDSIDWIGLTFYRWYFNRDDEMMESFTLEWCLRRFWKITREP